MSTNTNESPSSLEEENAELKRQLARTKKHKKKRKSGVNDELLAVITDTIKTKTWAKIKFISTDADLDQLALTILKDSGLEGYDVTSKDPRVKAQVDAWVMENRNACSSALNGFRSTVVSSMKTAATNYMINNKVDVLPETDKIGAIITRAKKVDLKLFAWWWEKFLPAATGNTTHWDNKIHLYNTISESRIPNSGNRLSVPSSTEGFAYVVHHSNRSRWMELHAIQKTIGGKKIVPLNKKKEGFVEQPGHHYCYVSENPKLGTLYTTTNVGQNVRGGWSDAGKIEYVKMTKMIKSARKTKESRDLEAKVLANLRTKYGAKARSFEEERAGSARAGKKKVATDTVIEDLLDLDDDDTDHEGGKSVHDDDDSHHSSQKGSHSSESDSHED